MKHEFAGRGSATVVCSCSMSFKTDEELNAHIEEIAAEQDSSLEETPTWWERKKYFRTNSNLAFELKEAPYRDQTGRMVLEVRRYGRLVAVVYPHEDAIAIVTKHYTRTLVDRDEPTKIVIEFDRTFHRDQR